MKKFLIAFLLTLLTTNAMATPLNIQLYYVQQPNNAFYPGPQYYFYGQPADVALQGGTQVDDIFYIATPANPSMNIYANLADAQAAYIVNDAAPLLSIVNGNYGTSYTSIGTVSQFNQQLQDAFAATTPATPTSTQVTRTIGTAYQATNSAKVNLVVISLTQAQTISLTTGQAGTLSLQTSPTSGGTYTEFSRIGNGNSGALTLGLGLTNTGTGILMGFVPAGYYYKIVAAGTGTNTYVTGQEITLN